MIVIAWIMAVISVIVLSLVPHLLNTAGQADKMLHIFAYCFISFIPMLLIERTKIKVCIAIGLFLMGIMNEYLQSIVGGRHSDISDAMMNGVGVILGVIVGYLIKSGYKANPMETSKKCLILALFLLSPFFSTNSAMAQTDYSRFQKLNQPDEFNGMLLGGFILYPQIQTDYIYDDNIFRTNNNPTSDQIIDVKPSMRVATNWNRHLIGIGADAGIGTYLDETRDDYKNFNLTANGRYDIAPFTDASFSISKFRQQAGSTGFEDQNLATEGYNTTISQEYSLSRALSYIRGKIFLRDKDTDLAKIGANDYQSLDSQQLGLDVSYDFMPNGSIFANHTLEELSYLKNNSQRRRADGSSSRLGIEYESGSGIYKWSIFGGHLDRDINDNIADVKKSFVGGKFEWKPLKLTTISYSLDKRFSEVSDETAAGIIVTSQQLSMSHSFTPFLDGMLLFGKDDLNYINSPTSSARNNDVYYAGLTGDYQVSDTVSLRLSYNYSQRESATPSEEYKNNRSFLSLVYKR
jgi:VanZ family protein